jgi:outer membrane protein
MQVFHRISFILAVLLVTTHLSADEVGDLTWLLDQQQRWALGASYRVQTSPYQDETTLDDFIPLIIYNGERTYLAGTSLGVHLVDNDKWEIDSFIAYRFGGFNEENSDFLDGMERDDSVDLGVSFTRNTNWGDFSFTPAADISGNHRGWETEFRWQRDYERGRWRWQPWIGVTYQDSELSQYYYGVEPDEAEIGRPAYDTDDSTSASIGANIDFRLNSNIYLSLSLEQERLDSKLADSPIVDERNLFKMSFGIRHAFDDDDDTTQYKISKSDSWLDGQWFWRVAAGVSTDSKFNDIVTGEINRNSERTRIASLFAGKKVGNSLFGWPLDVYIKGGVAYHDERDLQGDFAEYILAVKIYFNRFPWSDRWETRWGFAEGISYASKVPMVERENVESKNRSASHLLNYLDWSLDVNMGDLFKSPRLKSCYLGWAIHHRSGIFGNVDLFGNVDGGSNYNTLYVECLSQRGEPT